MAKTVDPKCYDLAKVWLANEGWTHTEDVAKLAQRIQDTIEDYVAELEHDYDKEREHGKR